MKTKRYRIGHTIITVILPEDMLVLENASFSIGIGIHVANYDQYVGPGLSNEGNRLVEQLICEVDVFERSCDVSERAAECLESMLR